MAKTYSSNTTDVTFAAARCLPAEECIRGLPAVFDKPQQPWIQPWQALTDAIAAVITRYSLTINPLPDGSLLLQGNFDLCGSDGTHAKIGFRLRNLCLLSL